LLHFLNPKAFTVFHL